MPMLVPQALASVLGVKEEAGKPVTEALLRFARDRTLLLLLDNCEHLVAACAELAIQLLQSSPRVRILATSRESLHVRGETTYPVPPLTVPSTARGVFSRCVAKVRVDRSLRRPCLGSKQHFELTRKQPSPSRHLPSR